MKDNDKYGLTEKDIEAITGTLAQFSDVSKAVIFGSRAMGNYKPGSDVDMAIYTNNNKTVSQISYQLNEESLLPYTFDVIDYHNIGNPELTNQIDIIGEVLLTNSK